MITGAAGFIGANFTHFWLKNHPEDRVVALDALTYAGNIESLSDAREHESFEFVHGDIRDTELVVGTIRKHDINTIVHFAAESHVDRSIADPDSFIQTNVIGTYALLETVKKLSKQGHDLHFHHVSTDEVYGSLREDEPAFSESNQYAPNSPYAASKAASDHLVRAYNRTYKINTTISNCSNNYGPYQFPEKLIPLALVNLLTGKQVPIYGDGRNIRDWLYVEDHCHAIDLIIGKGTSGETYNVGGGAEVRNIDLVRELCRIVDQLFAKDNRLREQFPDAAAASGKPSDSLLTFVPDRPGHDRRYAINTAKIAVELGYKPTVSFADGLAKTVHWYLGHTAWWHHIMSGQYLQSSQRAHWLS